MIHAAKQMIASFLSRTARAKSLNEEMRKRAFALAIVTEESLLAKTEYLDLERIKSSRTEKLQKLLHHSYKHVDFYHDLFNRSGIRPEDISDETLLSRLPAVKKSDFLRYPVRYILAKNISPDEIFQGITSGSTGEPFRYFKDKKTRPAAKANFYRPWRWASIEPTAPTVHCSAPHATGKTPNTVVLHPHFIQEEIDEYADRIRKSGAKIIRGYPLTNFELLWTLRQKGHTDISFTHAFFVGHVISRGVRDFFKDSFGCEIYNCYASMETDAMAAECGEHNGLHINEENYIIEVTDEKDHPLPAGRRGKIIITSFLNEGMPYVRYDIGDIGMMLPGICSCGRTSRRLLIEGRKEDMFVRPDGQSIYPGILRDILDEYFFAFQRYQVVQTDRGSLTLRVVTTSRYSKNTLEKAVAELKACIGPLMNIEVEVVDHISPLPNGKFKYFISRAWREKFPKDFFEYHLPAEKEKALA